MRTKETPIHYNLFDTLTEEQIDKVFVNLANGLSQILSNKFDCHIKVSFNRKKEVAIENEGSDTE